MISAMILNVNGLNIPIKRQRMKEWTKKKKTHLCAAKGTTKKM